MAVRKKILTLQQWLIQKLDTRSCRSGKAEGMRHPSFSQAELDSMGGIRIVIPQAKELEQAGLIRVDWRQMGAEIHKIHFSADIVEELCQREGIESPRIRNLRLQEQVRFWKEQVKAEWLERYYDHLLERLKDGEDVKNPDPEDADFFRCLNGAVQQSMRPDPVWKRVFSASVLGDSKRFEQEYEGKLLHVLKGSVLYEEGMTNEEMLTACGILSYAQTLEWKGTLVFRMEEDEMDTSFWIRGTVLNAQTLERAVPVRLSGVRRIMTIENKANYEDMPFRADTLYIYCHGFFSPKERRFLEELKEIADEDTEYLHWGDMDYGGIRIFQFIRKTLFPKVKPYRMDRAEFEEAVRNGAGLPLEPEKRIMLEAMDAGELEELKSCILESGIEIEQEMLLAAQYKTRGAECE
ncbi:MAG: DUF2399 domain-containing protein [Clostridiales bacterium]|nr:DUF2399 domain-containing protein [Clostridiales bacterium]